MCQTQEWATFKGSINYVKAGRALRAGRAASWRTELHTLINTSGQMVLVWNPAVHSADPQILPFFM